MVIRQGEIADDIQERGLTIINRRPELDAQERAEREQAARAYAVESEKHFVDYAMDCIKSSVDALRPVRQVQQECWRMYQEKEPDSFRSKAAWQSRIVVPKPFQAVQFAAAAIKKSFSPTFLSIADPLDQAAGAFWQKQMEHRLGRNQGKFPIKFVDATTMSLAVGVSLEMIPVWRPGRGLFFDLIEPWKIHRDPDAPSRDPQGGLYWIHQEWLDLHVLKAGEKSGRYFGIERVNDVGQESADNPFMTKEAISERKKQLYYRSKYRPMVLTSEFWGVVLDPKGNMLLPSATYTIAGGRVIQKPAVVRYQNLRWPGVSFSPLPDLLSHGGHGLLEGVRSIWEAMCNLLCLHEDGMKWLVNPMTEINVDGLVDPTDVEIWPGKNFLASDTANGQQAVRTVQRRDVTGSVLANLQYHDQNFQRGTAVSDGVQGLPGYRKDVTWRESEQNLTQAMGVFGLMAEALEDGAVAAIQAAQEVVRASAGLADYAQVMSQDELAAMGLRPDLNKRPAVAGVPIMSGAWRVSGIQQLMKDQETVGVIKGMMLPLAQPGSIFAPYLQPFNILKALEKRSGLEDEKTLVDPELGQALQDAQKQAMIAPPPTADPAAGGEPGPGGPV